jgi:hypothetical protein
MKRTVFIFVLVICGLSLGFYQEKLKISINYILDQSGKIPGFFNGTAEQKKRWIEANRFDAPFEYYHNHETVEWLYKLNASELGGLKWGATILFSVLFFVLNAAMLNSLGAKEGATTILLLFYLVLAALAFGIYALGIALSEHVHFYAISRKIMGALQSMVPVLIIWPSYRLWKYTQNAKNQ